MAYEKNPSNLWRKNANSPWCFKLGIPSSLRKHYPSDTPGKFKTHVVQSLKTHSRAEAMRLKEPLVALYRAEFKALASGVVTKAPTQPKAQVEDLRQAMRELSESPLTGDELSVQALAVHDAIERTHKRIRREEGEVAAAFAVRRMAQPDRASLNEALAAFTKASTNKAQTVETYRLAVREFLAFLGVPDCFPEDVPDAKTVAYVDALNAGPLSKTVKVKRIGGLHQIWESMRRRGWPRSPWDGHKLTKPVKAPVSEGEAKHDEDDNEDVRPFTEAEALKVFALPAPQDKRQRTYTRPLFRELYALGFTTGMRLNEIASLRPIDVAVLDDVWRVVSVPETVAKTKAGTRKIPVCHPVAVAILDARLKRQESPKGRLFSECSPGGPDGKPSWHVSKAMSRERLDEKRLGFTSEVNFHSTRRSFATLLENKSMAEPITQQRYIGHAISSLMHATYSGGAGLEKLKAVVAGVSYSPALEDAIRLAMPQPD